MGASLLAVIPALLGMMLGQWLRQRISASVFKRVFFIGMALLGLHLLIRRMTRPISVRLTTG
jgi:uncharacterized membrane protein YfcA